MALGIPTDADPSDDVWLDHRAYVVSYNPRRNGPNWVAWQLDRSHLGEAARRNDFRADPTLPHALYHVGPHDYAHSGYERGHLCPSADRTQGPEENSLTFLMTNMLPQVRELNGGPWKKLEEYERALARDDQAQLYLVAGGVFADTQPTIGHGISVPVATYKIIVAARARQTALDVTTDTNVIAALMPNDATAAAHDWTDFVTSVDAIEATTGYDFLSRVPKAVQEVIEARVTEVRADRPRRRRSPAARGRAPHAAP